MGNQIKTWQIKDEGLVLVESSLAEAGRREAEHLEKWIASDVSILGSDLLIIGRQIMTKSGPLDLLAIDALGNVVIIELKRDRLPREVVAQVIDYASDVANWSVERLSEECAKYSGKSLEDAMVERFDEVDLENININEDQRMLVVGFSAESSLVRMVEWLSAKYGVNINALILHYVRTSGGDEILTRSMVISEDEQIARTKGKKFKIPMSDEPGDYEDDELEGLLTKYLSSGLWSARRIRDVLLPACLKKGMITRAQLVLEFMDKGLNADQAGIGRFISLISSQFGMAKNDFLRQAIGYSYPENPWQKDNYFIRDEYKEMIARVLAETTPDEEEALE